MKLVLVTVAVLLGGATGVAQARDETITSFDGTPIVAHWFPQPALAPGAQAPTVLMGPGWGSAGDDKPQGGPIKRLHDAGYNVLTWDPRGFGKSGGVVTIDSKDFEGRDVQRLIDWVATQPETQLDGPGDPRMGMSGGSYGGGIQFVTAALDKRVDAIVPNIAWHSLRTSLYRGSIVKLGWAGRLFQVAASRPLDPHIKAAYDQGVKTGALTDANLRWVVDRGPGDALINRVTVPTLIQQGTVDTLFTLDETIRNFHLLKQRKVPVAMLWFCGGHGVCLTDPGDTERVARSTVAWLDRYVKRDASAPAVAGFDWIDQNGKRFTARDFDAVRTSDELVATGRGRLKLVKSGGSGPAKPPKNADIVGAISVAITPAKAANAVNVRAKAKRAMAIVGAPTVTVTYRGRATGAKRPERVFAQLVDGRTGHVLGNHVTPIRLKLDGKRRTVTTSLETVAHSLPKGGTLTLQLVATTVAYAQPRLGGRVDFSDIALTLPVRR